MRTSCRFGMAVHILSVLAYKHGDWVTSGVLANSINTNPVIVRRLLLGLQKAKLIETQKGAGFGSRLMRLPARINLAEVYRAVEETDAFAMPSRKPNLACPVGNCIRSELEKIFVSAEEALELELSKTNLSHILKRAQESREKKK